MCNPKALYWGFPVVDAYEGMLLNAFKVAAKLFWGAYWELWVEKLFPKPNGEFEYKAAYGELYE